MRILITSDWYYPVVNGVVRSVMNLIEYLEGRGHEVRVLTLSNTTKSYRDGKVYYVGSLSAEKIYPQARISNLLAKSHLKEIKDWEPDVVHSQCEFSTFIMAKRIASDQEIPLVHTYHTVYEDYTHYFIPSKQAGKKLVSVASKTLASFCDRIIVPTSKTERLLTSYGIDPYMIDIIPTGIHIPEMNDKALLRKSLGIAEDEKVLLYLGRLGAEKNIQEIMFYYDRLKNMDIKLYIVGGGPYLATLKEDAEEISKKVVFTGMVDSKSVNRYYQAADIFVTASTSETQGLTYYEALANGTIALCRDDAVLDGVIKNGFNGFKYRDFKEFENFVERVFADLEFKELLEINARNYARENFSVDGFGAKCLASYEKAIEEYEYESINIFKRL
ncbi:glycosyltransferase [uncultured Anaerococcus sp.]|uniref:glycosyltransferase n=1 Tax=uncultured Anaerococcus sp. TaxID=293428 RepID=UPI002636665E|nr:glycosyltransferase [uncultured Anaerococcus sp.]